jgi:hypothetical protein
MRQPSLTSRTFQIPKLGDPALATMLFSCTSNMAHTKSFTPSTQKQKSFRPSGIQDIKHQSKIQERQDFLDRLLAYYRLSRSEGVTHRELIQSRPEADVCCIGDYYDQAQGTVWDLRGSTPKPMDKIDKQLMVLVMKGVCTMNNMCYQTTNASPSDYLTFRWGPLHHFRNCKACQSWLPA